MAQLKQLVITAPQAGVADSPFVGFGEIRNCSLGEKPGSVMVGLLPEEQSSAIIGASYPFTWIRQNPTNGNFYAVALDGGVFKRVYGATTWTDISSASSRTTVPNPTSGNGLVIWKGYALILKDTKIDVLRLSDDTYIVNNWAPDGFSMTTDTWHPALVGQDDIVYIGHANYIMSLQENGTFAGTDGTVTTTQQALDLPASYRIRSLQELGKNLMIGTRIEGTTGIMRQADIFPWDRLSQSFGIPIKIEEFGIQAMLSHNNILYFIAGFEGQLYATDGSRVTKLRKIPLNLLGTTGYERVQVFPDAMVWYQEKLYFGISVESSTVLKGLGVWSYDSGKLLYEYQPSFGNTDSTSTRIYSLYAWSKNQILISWHKVNTDAGIDDLTPTKRWGSYNAFFETKFYDLSAKYSKTAFRTLEVRLGKDLKTNEGVRVKYRTDTDDAWTTLATFTAADSTHRQEVFLTVEAIQLRVELTTDGAGGNSNSSPEYLALFLYQ